MCLKRNKGVSMKKGKRRFLEKLDIFGVEINIKFNQQNKHTTRFGGIITLIIIGILFLLLTTSIDEIIYKNNPTIFQDLKVVDNPSRYNFTNNNFSFVVALLDESFIPIMDERIFHLEGLFIYKEIIQNNDGENKKQNKLNNKKINLKICDSNDFQVVDTIQYFQNLNYTQMYCIKNIEDLYLQGQIENNEYSTIEIKVIACEKNDNNNNNIDCLDSESQKNILSKSMLKIYYNTQIIQVQNSEYPFKSVVQSNVWETSIDHEQKINMLFQNTFIEDDIGIFSRFIKTNNSLAFSSEQTMLTMKQDSAFYKIIISLEKNQEKYYHRQYQKLTEALSKVGGIYNFLFVLGCIIAQPYSQMQLQRKLFNQTFQVAKNQVNKSRAVSIEEKNNTSLDKNCKASISHKKPFQMTDLNIEPKSDKKIQFSITPQIKSTKIINKKTQKIQFDEIQRRISLFNVSQQQVEKPDSQKSNHFKDLGKTLKNELNNFKVKTTEYLSYYLNCFNCFKFFQTDIQDMVSFGTQKIYDYTDICFIVNKLLEIEKLKHLILNEQQIKLFEFIPKPKIDLDIIKSYKNQDINNSNQIIKEQENSLQQHQEEEKNSQQLNQIEKDTNTNENQHKKQINILSIQNRTIQEKSIQAQAAFNHIYKNQFKKSKVDLKLIQMLDENLVQLFHNNTFDDSTIHSQSNQNINQAEFMLSSFHRRNSNNKIKLEKSIFQSTIKKTEDNESESLDPNDELRDEDQKQNQKSEGVIVYENKKKHFLQYTEFKNSNRQHLRHTTADCFIDSNQTMQSPKILLTESLQLTQFQVQQIPNDNEIHDEEFQN